MALMTHERSSLAALARAAALELLDEAVGDADSDGVESEGPGEIIDAPDGPGGAVSTWLETSRTLLTSESSSLGRERASATTLALPWRYLISVVNSEMQAS